MMTFSKSRAIALSLAAATALSVVAAPSFCVAGSDQHHLGEGQRSGSDD